MITYVAMLMLCMLGLGGSLSGVQGLMGLARVWDEAMTLATNCLNISCFPD